MQTVIRKAELNDAQKISYLTGLLGYESEIRSISNRLKIILADSRQCVFVADIDNCVAGWVYAFLTERVVAKPFVEIGGLVVDVKHCKKGVGKMLIAETVNWAKIKNCNVIRLRSNVTRTGSHAFYGRLGFELIKEQKVFSESI